MTSGLPILSTICCTKVRIACENASVDIFRFSSRHCLL